jgi:gluconate 5-dehydrogenase
MDNVALFTLEKKTAVVIGGAGGLGKTIAQGIVMAGAKTIIVDINEDVLSKAKGEIKAACGKDVGTAVVDATNEDSVIALVEKTAKELGKVDILVCAQGINKKFPAEDFPVDAYRALFEVNVLSIMLCCKHYGRHMIENKYGKMVIISSVRGKIATRGAGNVGYCTTKGAVDMLTRQLASEFGQHGITVNAIGPTVTETPMMTEVIEQRGGDAYRQSLVDQLPMRRMALPEYIVGTAIFLAAEASDFMTGNILYPDGGLTAVG